MAAEADSVKRLTAVTEKLKKIEADRAWNLSKEGKDANKRLKELQLRIKKEDKLLDKQAADTNKLEDIEAKRSDQAGELARLEEQIAFAKTSDAAKDRKADLKFQKQETKLQEKLRKSQRNFGKEFYDSIFGTYSLIGSLKDMFPKPVQILAGWGFDKIKKGLIGSVKGIGKLAKAGFGAMMGDKPEAGASPEVKAAAEDVAPSDAAVPKKKLGPLQTWMSNLSGKGGGEEGGAEEVIAMDSVVGDAGESIDELKKQTALLSIIAGASEGPDASKTGESVVEKEEGGGVDIDIDFKKGRFGKILASIGIVLALIAAPFIALIAFFKEFGAQTAKIAKGFGKIIGKALKPIINFFGKNSVISKAVTGISTAFSSMAASIKGSKLPGVIARVGKVFKDGMAALGKIFAPITSLFKSVSTAGQAATGMTKTATAIKSFAAGFGRVLGKIFWPITLIMSVFDFITGFIDGYKQDGILGGLEGGLSKMLSKLIGFPLDLLKKGIAWILGKFGFDNAKAVLESFSFSQLIKDMIGGVFDMIKGAVNWVKQLFTDPVAALKALWDGAMGGLKSISDVILWPINTAIDWILGIFGLKEEGAPKFSLWSFIFGPDGIFAKAWKWITGIFTLSDEQLKAGATLWEWIKGLPGRLWTWIKDIFTISPENLAAASTLWDWIKGIPGRIWTWIKGIFGFSDEDPKVKEASKGFSLISIVTDALDDIMTWFKDLFDIDWGGLMNKLVPDWAKKILPGFDGGDKPKMVNGAFKDQSLGGAKDQDLYDDNWAGDSTINRAGLQAGVESGKVQKEMLQAIIDDEDISEQDLAFMKKLVEQATKKGSLYTHDIHVENILRKGFGIPSGDTNIVPNNQLTPGNDIAAASSNMYSGGAGGGNTNVIAPVTTNSSSSTIVNVQTPRMATDPNTQKQSGYALSGWAKFD